MSFPPNGSVEIKVRITAEEALRFAWEINTTLSRVADIQKEKSVDPQIPYALSEEIPEEAALLSFLRYIKLGQNVSVTILPDTISQDSSGYQSYSTPQEEQYIPKKKK